MVSPVICNKEIFRVFSNTNSSKIFIRICTSNRGKLLPFPLIQSPNMIPWRNGLVRFALSAVSGWHSVFKDWTCVTLQGLMSFVKTDKTNQFRTSPMHGLQSNGFTERKVCLGPTKLCTVRSRKPLKFFRCHFSSCILWDPFVCARHCRAKVHISINNLSLVPCTLSTVHY